MKHYSGLTLHQLPSGIGTALDPSNMDGDAQNLTQQWTEGTGSSSQQTLPPIPTQASKQQDPVLKGPLDPR